MGSQALQADATWVCAHLSLALLLGVGAFAAFGWSWADPVGALLILPVIVWQGWGTLEEARVRTAIELTDLECGTVLTPPLDQAARRDVVRPEVRVDAKTQYRDERAPAGVDPPDRSGHNGP